MNKFSKTYKDYANNMRKERKIALMEEKNELKIDRLYRELKEETASELAKDPV